MPENNTAILRLNRTEEGMTAANTQAVKTLEKAGYDPIALVTLQEKLLILLETCDITTRGCTTHLTPKAHHIKELRQHITSKNRGGELGKKAFTEQTQPLRTLATAYNNLDNALRALASGTPSTALTLAEQGLKEAPHEGRFHYVIGTASMHLGQFSNAIAHLNQAFEADDTYFDYYLQRGLSHANLGYAKKAEADLRNSISLLNTAEAHYHLADILYEGRSTLGAVTHFEIAANVDSPVMLLAQEQLARLDIPNRPTKYLHLQAALDERGFLSLAVVNDCSIPVKDVFVSIDAVDAPGVTVPNHVIRYSEPTPEGAKQLLFTGAGPFENMEQLKKSLKVEIMSAIPFHND
jgi:tetratricopeptide (TPR) repeat protein